jgi:SNF2 family DNA or RNA helicase
MKTASCLWAADYLMTIGKVKRALIVAPLSTLEPTWGQEIFKNFPKRKYAILHGTRDKRQELLKLPHDFYVCNHDGAKILHDDLLERADIDLIIFDELAVARNARTGRWKVMNSIINKCGFSRAAWGLTGAPTPNAPTDAFGQCKLIKPENYKGHFTSFKNQTMYQVNTFKWLPRKGAEETVNQVLKPSVRYALEDCVDLPETIYSEREAQLSKEQDKHYNEIKRLAVTEIKGQTITAVNAAVQVNKILQSSLGVLYSASGEVVKIDFGPRISLLKEIIESCERKVIVFVPLTGALNAVKQELSKHWTVESIDGSTSMNKRNQIFSAFRTTKDPHVLVANAAAMSHGLTLTEASTIIWYAPVTSADIYNQANARIVRPGQKHVTNIVHIYATPEERRTYTVVKDKLKLQDVLLELIQKGR